MSNDHKLLAARVREAGDAYLRNERDFRHVTLAFAKALWTARQAVGGDDTAFGRWLAKHKLANKVGATERAALIQLGQHAKIAAKVLATTTSRSPRLIWENEVRQRVAFPSAGKGHTETKTQVLQLNVTTTRLPLRVPVLRVTTTTHEPRDYATRAAAAEPIEIVAPARGEQPAPKPVTLTRPAWPSQPQPPMLTSEDFAAISRKTVVTEIITALRGIAYPIEHSAHLSVEAVADVLSGDAKALTDVTRTLEFAARLKDALDRRAHEVRPPLKVVN
jgi:hypothetical protein